MTMIADFLSNPVIFLIQGILSFVIIIPMAIIKLTSKGMNLLLEFDFNVLEIFPVNSKLIHIGLIKIAACFMFFYIVIDLIKHQSGVDETEKKSFIDIIVRIGLAGILVTALTRVIDLFYLISKFFNQFLGSTFNLVYDYRIDQATDEILKQTEKTLLALKSLPTLTSDFIPKIIFLIICLILFSLAFILIGFSIMKRLVELYVAMCFIPIIAVSVYKDFDKLNTWLSKVSQIFAGQMLNLLMLNTIIGLSSNVFDISNEQSGKEILTVLLIAACISVAVNGIKTIQDYIVSTGTGRSMSPSSIYYGVRGIKSVFKR